MNPAMPISDLSRILITIAAAILIIAGMKAAAPLIGPLIFSIFLAVIFGILLHWFEKKGFSTRRALFFTLVIFFAIIAVFITAIVGSLFPLLSELPSTTCYSESGNGIGYNYLSIRGFDQRRISVLVNGIRGQLSGRS